LISLQKVSKSFGVDCQFAVKNLSLEIAEGETLVLLGSSGCGKTTTLKMINRLIEPTSGRIEVDGRNVMDVDPVQLRRSIGYVFQGIGLFPHMRVEDNVAVVLRLLGWSRKKRRQRARELLSLVELEPDGYAKRYPGELSGGEQQRIGVARALAADPAYLLMDEPFGALDALTRDTLQKELLKLKERLRKTIIFVTHDILEALTLADRIAVMHEGELQQVGTRQQLLKKPATDFVRNLFAMPAEQLATFENHLS
jgi:osmoprotectant transport system ATP-binding protein